MSVTFLSYNFSYHFVRGDTLLGQIETFGMTRIKAVCNVHTQCNVFIHPRGTIEGVQTQRQNTQWARRAESVPSARQIADKSEGEEPE